MDDLECGSAGNAHDDFTGVLRNAPNRAKIGTVEYDLTASCWLDLMPPVLKTGAPLRVRVTILILEGALPSGMSIRGV